jgi:ornithine cyclodeaminase/alanine dehydrogenase
MSIDVLWLSQEEIASLGISMREVMNRVAAGFTALGREEVEMPAKIGIHPRENCFIHAMPCWVGGAVDACGIKCVSGYPINQPKGLPYITGVFCLIDTETGLVKSVMDAGWITAWRTGAASGVYAENFGNPETAVVSIIGLGVQGRANLRAMGEVFKGITRVQLYDTVQGQVESFLTDMRPEFLAAEFVPCEDVKTAVHDADVVITCTPIVEKPERFVKREWLKDEVMAISVDYDSALHEDVMKGTFVCDNRNQYLWTQNQRLYFLDGYPGEDGIFADMGEICAGKKAPVMQGLRGAVLMGIASHDVMTGDLVYEKALEKNCGTLVHL